MVQVAFVLGIALFALALLIAWGGRALGLWGGAAVGPLPTSLPIGSWRSYSPPDAPFSIDFPVDPQIATRQYQGSETSGASAATQEGEFFVTWTDIGATGLRPDFGPAMASSMATRRSATIESEGAVVASGQAAYKFVLEIPSDCAPTIPGACRLTWVAVPAGTRLYSMGTAVPDPPGASDATERFLTSFAWRE